MEKRAAATFPTGTTTEAGTTSIEELSQEISSRLRSAQHQTGLISRSYCHRLQGTLQSSSGGFLDSHITIEIKPQDPSSEGSSKETPSKGFAYPVRDPLVSMPDCETANAPYERPEEPFVTTRKF